MSRAYVTLTVDQSAPYAPGFVETRNTVEFNNGVATLEINSALALAIRPRGPVEQRLAIKVTAHLPGGVGTLWGGDLLSWRVEESTQGVSWTLTVDAGRETPQGGFGRGFFGWELDFDGAPPPGKGLVLLELLYDLPDGELVPFALFAGHSVESTRTDSRDGGHRIVLTGMDGRTPFDRANGRYQLGPQHGLTHGQIARGYLEAIGVPASRITIGADVGSVRTNPVDLPCAEGWAPAVAVLRAAGFLLKVTREDPPRFEAVPHPAAA